ncbi:MULTISPECIES: bestrophin family protein [unclassified Flavobacterium]|jgi:putative membrane protein|uniref:bestrophin family protein n=1 Tax=unclassified Flavobacterium TaxID=196869 RepID=UPI0025BE9420|nr:MULTISPECIES: bestrophin family ion channel [unclassified Flavobacterium]
MITKKKTNWFRMLFEWNGSVLPQLLPRLLLLFSYSLLIVYFRDDLLKYHLQINPSIFTLFGIALAIFLGFRNTVSYDRFWEGRKLWGSLLNDTRSLARQAHTIVDGEDYENERTYFINLLIALVHALKHQLRQTDADNDMKRLLSNSDNNQIKTAVFKPIMILKELGCWVKKAKANGKIDSIIQSSFDVNLNKLSDIIGGCERIASTPIPYTYSILLHRTVYIYCFLLPFGFVESMVWIMPFVVVFITYTFVALEAIADELEEPFGIQPNDLALEAMSEMIENTLAEINNKQIQPITPSKEYYII